MVVLVDSSHMDDELLGHKGQLRSRHAILEWYRLQREYWQIRFLNL